MFDVVIDFVGGPAWPDLILALKPGGQYAVSGTIAGPIVQADLRDIYLRDITIHGCTHQTFEVFGRLVKMMNAGRIKPLISKTYPLREISTAQADFQSKAFAGKKTGSHSLRKGGRMADITLLDGSIGQELVKRGGEKPTALWSTRVMMDQPELVGQVHADYFRRGATVATTNTYAVHRSRLAREGIEDQLPALIDAALAQAERARAPSGGRIAGALGPLLASYRPDLKPDVEDAAVKYAELVDLMNDRVDLFLHETVSSLQEAEGALRGTENATKPVWLALSVMDNDGTHLRSGEHLAQVATLVDRFAPEAVLINCTRPEAVLPALMILQTMGLPYGAYANGFTGITQGFLEDAPTVDALEHRHDLSPEAYADFAMAWVEHGATIVGGCCEVGPDHIEALAHALHAARHRIV